MKKLTILVDMDDVLENLVECWVNELNKKCGSSLREEDITDWRIAKFFPQLLEMYPYLKWEDVIVASDKSLVNGDIMIDDGTHNLETTSCDLPILFDRPHNRSYNDLAAGMVRVETWDEIYEVVSDFAELLSADDEIDRVLKGVDVESV